MSIHTCEMCGKEFASKSYLSRHYKRKTPCEPATTVTIEEKSVAKKPELQKPFLKWVGGKSQILSKVVSKIPSTMNSYREIFLGGGSVLLAVLSLKKQGILDIKNRIYAYDVNEDLVNVYKHIQNDKDELYEIIQRYLTEYDSIQGSIVNRTPRTEEESLTSKESYYYWVRYLYNTINKGTVECSAIFMFLNKTCFRGVYRVGPNGYNVPFGHYKTTPCIISREDLDNVSELIQDVEFVCSDFRDSLSCVEPGDYVYLDPPYAPETKTSFVKYSDGGFTLDMHNALFERIVEMSNNDIKFTMSNARVELVTEYFNAFECEELVARRAINSKNPGTTTVEVLINN